MAIPSTDDCPHPILSTDDCPIPLQGIVSTPFTSHWGIHSPPPHPLEVEGHLLSIFIKQPHRKRNTWITQLLLFIISFPFQVFVFRSGFHFMFFHSIRFDSIRFYHWLYSILILLSFYSDRSFILFNGAVY